VTWLIPRTQFSSSRKLVLEINHVTNVTTVLDETAVSERVSRFSLSFSLSLYTHTHTHTHTDTHTHSFVLSPAHTRSHSVFFFCSFAWEDCSRRRERKERTREPIVCVTYYQSDTDTDTNTDTDAQTHKTNTHTHTQTRQTVVGEASGKERQKEPLSL